MKLRSLFTLCLTVATVMAAQAKDYKYQTVAGDVMNTRIYKLDNGLTVYLSVNKEKPRIQANIAVRTGSRNDPAETTGLAHYLEHIMFKGTQKFGTSDAAKEAPLLKQIEDKYEYYRTLTDTLQRKQCYREIDSISQLAARYSIPNEYDKLMTSIGAQGTNAYTSYDVTCYVEDIPSNEVENWAKVQADRFMNMTVRGFHTELEAVYEEYNMHLASDGDKVINALFAKMFPAHPYGTQTVIGTQEHLKNPSIVNIKNYFNRYYRPNNVAICMSGDFDPDRVMATIDKYFGPWQPNSNLSRPEYAPVKPLVAPADTSVVGQEAERLMMGWVFDGAASRQMDTLTIIDNIMANGKAGLIDLNVNQQMKTLGAWAGIYGLADYSAYVMGGSPKQGQTLEQVRDIMLEEIDKLKRGDFDDKLIASVMNNLKRSFYRSLESNASRADKYVDAFINGESWADQVARLDRMAKITKKDVVDFARRHFGNGYVAVFKRTGVDSTQKKIDKPQITAIPANRDRQSAFVTEIAGAKVEPIQPRFVDFNTDLAKGKTKKNLPLLYVKNTSDGLFTLAFRYEYGEESNKWLPFATQYVDLLGTDKLTAEQVKQQFYALACDYSINVGHDNIVVTLNGLGENMTSALKLMQDFIANAQVDKDAYRQWVEQTYKGRKDAKLNQRANFNALYNYVTYGEYNPQRNIPDSAELADANPQTLIDMVRDISAHEVTVCYYGPMEMKELAGVIDKNYRCPKQLKKVPQGRKYVYRNTDKNRVFMAPYDAKNIYLRQYYCAGNTWNAAEAPVKAMFNEYFGGGMNSVVFQEMRETRALAYNAWAMFTIPSAKDVKEFALTHIISQNDKMMDCINTFNSIITNMPQSEKAFNIAKQSLAKRLEAKRTTRIGIINAYLYAKEMGIDYDTSKKIYEALPAMTLKDVVEFEQKKMAGKPYFYMILGNGESLDTKALEKIAPIQHLTTEDIFGY